MRVIISAVVNSLAVNLGVLALSGVGLLIFAILGLGMFAGQFYSCSCSHVYPHGLNPTNTVFGPDGSYTIQSINFTIGPSSSPAVLCSECERNQESVGSWSMIVDEDSACLQVCAVQTQQHCVGNDGSGGVFGVDPLFPDVVGQCYWDNRPYNFDTVPNAMMALFSASTLAGWTDIMEIGLDTNGIGYQPVPFSKLWEFKVIYFLIYVVVMSFFVTNLFVGVLIDFIGHSDGSALLTESQKQNQDMQKFKKMHRPAVREQP
eukprot:COSAG05_NODE_6872_length_889_cov_2.424051_1_plen_260_part_10